MAHRIRASRGQRAATALAVATAATMLLGALTACTAAAPPASQSSTAPAPSSPAAPDADASPTFDPWARHFAEEAERGGYMLQIWGGFGPEGGVSATLNLDLTVQPGAHRVRVLCAGPDSVALTVSEVRERDGMHEPGASIIAATVDCHGGVVRDFVTQDQGVALELDSAGQPGAFLLQLDPGETALAP